jgi:hypothetical protein
VSASGDRPYSKAARRRFSRFNFNQIETIRASPYHREFSLSTIEFSVNLMEISRLAGFSTAPG